MSDNKILSQQQLMSVITFIIVLVLINIFLTSMTARDSTNLRGEIVEAHSYAMKKAILTTLIFSIQVIGSILGAITALIPYKGFSYKQKYLPASLISIIGIHLIIATISIMRIL
jgi:hypothetical protein